MRLVLRRRTRDQSQRLAHDDIGAWEKGSAFFRVHKLKSLKLRKLLRHTMSVSP